MIVNEMFLAMEDEAMRMLINSDANNSHLWHEQYSNAIVSERRFTGCGFFTEFEIPDCIGKLEGKYVSPIGTVVGRIGDLGELVGFLLFFQDGRIDCLECHEWDIMEFPTEITNFTLSYAFYDDTGLLRIVD